MAYKLDKDKIRNEHTDKLHELSGENVFDCYQCGNCSSGCPMVDYMDIAPNRVMRLAQMGIIEEILNSETIWICSACYQCSTRCPKGIDVAKVMEGFRVINLRKREGKTSPDEISPEDLKKLPPIVLVSVFRKLSG